MLTDPSDRRHEVRLDLGISVPNPLPVEVWDRIQCLAVRKGLQLLDDLFSGSPTQVDSGADLSVEFTGDTCDSGRDCDIRLSVPLELTANSDNRFRIEVVAAVVAGLVDERLREHQGQTTVNRFLSR